MSNPARGYVLECYWPGVTEQAVRETAERAGTAAAELRSRGRDVSLREAILMRTDETVFCLFDGVEADVRAAGELAGIRFERVLESVWVAG
jgi:hypothetical protein